MTAIVSAYHRRLWKARIRLFLHYWLVDTFGWFGCYLPLIVLWVHAWASISGVVILEPVPDFGGTMDPAGPGYSMTVTYP